MNLDSSESVINLMDRLRSLSRCILNHQVLCISVPFALANAGFNFLVFSAFSVFITLLKDSIYYTESILTILNLPY